MFVVSMMLSMFSYSIHADTSEEETSQTVYEETGIDLFTPIIRSFRELINALKSASREGTNQIVAAAVQHLGDSYADPAVFLQEIYAEYGVDLSLNETRAGGPSWSDSENVADITYNIYEVVKPGDILAWYIVADNVTGSPDMCAIYTGGIHGEYYTDQNSNELMISTEFGPLPAEGLTIDNTGYIRTADDFGPINCIAAVDGTVSFFDFHSYVDVNGYAWPSYTHLYAVK